MNVQYKAKNIIFNLRVGGLCIKGSKVLLVYYPSPNIWSLPGGRCQIGEDTIKAVVREFKEETGFDVKVDKTTEPFLMENFFKILNEDFHEILIIHKITIPEKSDLYINDDFVGNEAGVPLQYKWIELADFSKYPIKPDNLYKLVNPASQHYYIIK